VLGLLLQPGLTLFRQPVFLEPAVGLGRDGHFNQAGFKQWIYDLVPELGAV